MKNTFLIFANNTANIQSPNRLLNFINLVIYSLQNNNDITSLQLIKILSKIALVIPIILHFSDHNENYKICGNKLVEFMCNSLLGKIPKITEKLNGNSIEQILAKFTSTNYALKFLSLPETSKPKFNTEISTNSIFTNTILLASAALSPKPKSNKFNQYQIYLAYLNYALGNPLLYQAFQQIINLDLVKIATQLTQNINSDIQLHIQTWKYNRRLFFATHNFVKLTRSLSAAQAVCSWSLISTFLSTLSDYHPENTFAALKNPINKTYKDYKIIQTVIHPNWNDLLVDLEKLASEKYVKHYIENIGKTPFLERSKVTENFAGLCISMIDLAKSYENHATNGNFNISKMNIDEETKNAGILQGDEMEMDIEEIKDSSKSDLSAAASSIYKSTFEQNLLTHLSFGSKILLNYLWQIIEPCKTKESLISNFPYTLQLFCKLYLQVLFVMDDLEFMGKSSGKKDEIIFALKNEQLKWFSQTINEVVYKLFIEHGASQKYYSLRYDALRLLKHLYDRIRRNKIFPDEFWYLSHSKVKSPLLDTILSNIPHVIPFDQRVAILRQKLLDEKAKFGGHAEYVIHRDHIFEDSLMTLHKLGSQFKYDIGIQFTNKYGIIESGVGHGVFKEFLTVLSKKAFDLEQGFFIETKNRELFPNPDFIDKENYQRIFEFLGMIVGKAIYEGILIQPIFSRCFLNKVLGKSNHIDELKLLDEKLYENVMFLKSYEVFFINILKIG